MDEKKNLEMLKAVWESLTDDQKEKVKGCKNVEEVLTLISEWQIELPAEALESVAGGYIYMANRSDCRSYEVLNDKTGDVMSRGHSYDGAVDKAIELGQSTEELWWYQVKDLRGCWPGETAKIYLKNRKRKQQ